MKLLLKGMNSSPSVYYNDGNIVTLYSYIFVVYICTRHLCTNLFVFMLDVRILCCMIRAYFFLSFIFYVVCII